MSKIITNVTLGCDPEVFLEKDGVIISAVGKIGGTKAEPKPISDNGHAVQEDNVAIEWNIPPSKNVDEFLENNNLVKNYLDAITTAMGCNLNFSASAELSDKELDSDQARLFGCEPDFNAYTRSMNNPPEAGGNLRSCGGHIAIGWDNNDTDTAILLVKAMDATAGLESLFLDTDERRKQLYGKAGCFRLKDFGVEYRTLSNFWVKDDESIKWAYETTMKAIELVNSGRMAELEEEYSSLIREAIDMGNKELAKELLHIVYVGEKELQINLT